MNTSTLRVILICVAASVAPLQSAEVPFDSGREALKPASALPQLSIQGNRFVNPAGQTVVLRGLALSDPAELIRKKQWSRGYFEAAKSWNANVVRVPVHPADWRRLGEDAYLKHLDEAVLWAGELGMYVIIDWHSIGNILTGVYHRPSYITSRDETFRFWYTIAERYKGNPVVAMYELFNEPTNREGMMGRLPWTDYKAYIEELIFMIRKIDPAAIPLVAGFNWGYDLTHVRDNPIDFPECRLRDSSLPSEASGELGGKLAARLGFCSRKISAGRHRVWFHECT